MRHLAKRPAPLAEPIGGPTDATGSRIYDIPWPWITVGAGVLLLGGGIYWLARRNKQLNGLGQVVSTTSADGMVTTHHRGPMPIKRRVALLQQLVWEGVQRPDMRKLALEITKKCEARDGECEAKAIYDYVRNNVRYTGDVGPIRLPDGQVEGVDLFQGAHRTLLDFHGGDCDDHAVANAVLAALNGFDTRFKITGPKGAAKNESWQHIYLTLGLGKLRPTRWVALDTTLPGENYGREAPYGEAITFPT
jgi:hypothetical protein